MLALGLSAACESSPDAIGVQRAPVIYAEDDREELYELESEPLRDRLARSVVAIVPNAAALAGGGLAAAPTLREQIDFCGAEPFADQPAPALCTGVLVDWDLVLTAAHCMAVFPLAELRAVFGWYYRAAGELAVTPESSYALAEIVAERRDAWDAMPRLDYAWVRLAHAVEPPLEPIGIARGGALDAQPLVIAGASYGLPLKVDRAATVRAARGPSFDFFVADSDTSHGASGGPALDGRHALLGVLARGGEDVEPTERGCFETVHVADASQAKEEFTYAARALEGLCERDPGSSLCRNDCGDPCSALPPAAPAPTCAAFGPSRAAGLPAAPVAGALALAALRRRGRRCGRYLHR
jgi:hypothetical protein